jgi:hypothetical protein
LEAPYEPVPIRSFQKAYSILSFERASVANYVLIPIEKTGFVIIKQEINLE